LISRLFTFRKNKAHWFIILLLAVTISSCSTAGSTPTPPMDSAEETSTLPSGQKPGLTWVPSLSPTNSAISTLVRFLQKPS